MSVILKSTGGGEVILQEPSTASIFTQTLPAQTGTVALLQTPSFVTTIGVGGVTPSTSGAGITFPATQSASTDPNTLDDYEEGTWTPILTNGTTNVTSYFYQGGSYIKIGKQVWVTIQLSVNTVGISSGNIKIIGLPFTPAQLPNIGSQTGYLINGLKYFSTTGALSLSLSQGSTEMIPYFSSTYGNQMTHTDLSTGGQWWAQGYYITAS